MARREYPDECPLFEITIDNGNFCPRGDILEGVEINENGLGQSEPGYIGLRVIDESTLRDTPRRHPEFGYRGIMGRLSDIRPLTPAARAMIAIAKAAK